MTINDIPNPNCIQLTKCNIVQKQKVHVRMKVLIAFKV